MTYRGHMKNGVVVLDEPAALPEGAEVRIEQVSQQSSSSWGEVFNDLSGKAMDLPEDLAKNHDHYLHGAPKK